jgi:hypothetical protein
LLIIICIHYVIDGAVGSRRISRQEDRSPPPHKWDFYISRYNMRLTAQKSRKIDTEKWDFYFSHYNSRSRQCRGAGGSAHTSEFFFLFLPIKMSLKDSTDEWEDRPHMWFFSLSTGILYYAVFENLLDWLQHVYSNVADWIPVIDLACYRYRYYRVQQLFFKPGHVLFHVSVYAIQIILAQNCLQ